MVMSWLFHAVGGLMPLFLLVEGHGERPSRNFFVCLSPRLNPRASGCQTISVRLVISLVGAGCVVREGVGGLNQSIWP